MNPEKILLPIDTRKCPTEVFSLVQGMADRCDLTIILLQVINLNIMPPERRIYGELTGEAHDNLRRIAREYLPQNASIKTRVRLGKPAEAILWEAKAEKVD